MDVDSPFRNVLLWGIFIETGSIPVFRTTHIGLICVVVQALLMHVFQFLWKKIDDFFLFIFPFLLLEERIGSKLFIFEIYLGFRLLPPLVKKKK